MTLCLWREYLWIMFTIWACKRLLVAWNTLEQMVTLIICFKGATTLMQWIPEYISLFILRFSPDFPCDFHTITSIQKIFFCIVLQVYLVLLYNILTADLYVHSRDSNPHEGPLQICLSGYLIQVHSPVRLGNVKRSLFRFSTMPWYSSLYCF